MFSSDPNHHSCTALIPVKSECVANFRICQPYLSGSLVLGTPWPAPVRLAFPQMRSEKALNPPSAVCSCPDSNTRVCWLLQTADCRVSHGAVECDNKGLFMGSSSSSLESLYRLHYIPQAGPKPSHLSLSSPSSERSEGLSGS